MVLRFSFLRRLSLNTVFFLKNYLSKAVPNNGAMTFTICTLLIFTLHSDLMAQLKQRNNRADYIVIVPSGVRFNAAVQEFVQWRSSKGLIVRSMSVDDIYKEFQTENLSKPEAIREFLSYALEYWQQPSPRYVLLAGGTSLIPSYRFPSLVFRDLKEDSVSLDEWFVVNKYRADTWPDAALGRFPARTVQQLRSIIAKTKRFEDELQRGSYKFDCSVLSASDNTTDGDYFISAANSFVNKSLPSHFRTQRVYYDFRESGTTKAKYDIADVMNNGTIFFNFYGHGSPTVWSQRKIFVSTDVDELLLKGTNPFIFTTAACSQDFDTPETPSTIEKLMNMEAGGAIATLGATGIMYVDAAEDILNKFYQLLLHRINYGLPVTTIGDAFLQTRLHSLGNVFGDNPGDQLIRRYSLLGDPALALPQEMLSPVYSTPVQPEPTALQSGNYPNPFSNYTRVRFTLSAPSRVTLKVLNSIGQVVFFSDEGRYHAGSFYIPVDLSAYSQGTYFYYLQVGEMLEKGTMQVVR